MNGLQRYLRTLQGEPVDFLPRTPILMRYAVDFIGTDYATFAQDPYTHARVNVTCARHFGIDLVGVMCDPFCETQGFGAEIIYEPNNIPYCRKHPLEDAPDLSLLRRPSATESERMRKRVEEVRHYHETVGGEFAVMGWVEGPAAEAADLRGVENFCMDLYDDPGFCHELMALCVEVGLDFAKHQLAAGATIIGVGDAVASQVAPDVYEALILPHEQRLIRGIRALGGKTRLHICGNITHLLPGIGSLEVDVLDVDHMVELPAVRRAVGPRVALGANLDPVAAMLYGTPASIQAALRKAQAEAGAPFIVNTGCEIPPGVPEANLKALCEPMTG